MDAAARVFASAVEWGLIVGGSGFALGFFGPIILAPGANQGPLLGIFITGPVGFLAGLVFGTVMGVVPRRQAGAADVDVFADESAAGQRGVVVDEDRWAA